jgi:DNA-binding MarR family transcriptional regulator/ribosomal protein S18 acetylase RimI-like enzyme
MSKLDAKPAKTRKPATTQAAPDPAIAAVRAFNRFYTRRIGALDEGLLATPFTLTESRLLWEFAHRDRVTASELARDLALDPGYLSRLLRGLRERGLIASERAAHDARHVLLAITPAGRKAFAPLDRRTDEQVQALLAPLASAERERLLGAMAAVTRLLDATPARAEPWLLRPHRPGDIGWTIARHGALYAQEYGWDLTFEALVAHIAAGFVERFDAAREACWIAERDGVNVGCVYLVQARDEETDEPVEGTAQLRLLLVEPSARGLGIGARLVAECERFARAAGYRRIVLWTNSVLTAARAIYSRQGYTLVKSETHASFGQEALVGETWELELGSDPARRRRPSAEAAT